MNLISSSTDSAKKTLHRTRQIYTKSNKSDTFLVLSLLKTDHATKLISLKLSRDTYTSNQLKVVQEFRTHLAQLYSASDYFDHSQADYLFSRISLLALSTQKHKELDKPITSTEVLAAIKTLKPHKCPGPYGLSATYYNRICRPPISVTGECVQLCLKLPDLEI